MSLLTENIQAGVPIEAPIIIRGSDICGVCDDKDTVEKSTIRRTSKTIRFYRNTRNDTKYLYVRNNRN